MLDTTGEFFDLHPLRATEILQALLKNALNEENTFKAIAATSKIATSANELALIVYHATVFLTQQRYSKVQLTEGIDPDKTNSMELLGVSEARHNALMGIWEKKLNSSVSDNFLETIAAVDQTGSITKNELVFITISAAIEYALTHPETITQFEPSKKS